MHKACHGGVAVEIELEKEVWRLCHTIDGRDRKRLERVCRYLPRPPFAHDAVEATGDGRLRVHFKAPSRRGAAFADMTTGTFLGRLCASRPRS